MSGEHRSVGAGPVTFTSTFSTITGLPGVDGDRDAIVLLAAALASDLGRDRRLVVAEGPQRQRAPRARCAPAAARRIPATGRRSSCNARTRGRRARWRGCPPRRRALPPATPARAGGASCATTQCEQRNAGRRVRWLLCNVDMTPLTGGRVGNSNESRPLARGFRAPVLNAVKLPRRSARIQFRRPGRHRRRSGARRSAARRRADSVSTVEQRVP